MALADYDRQRSQRKPTLTSDRSQPQHDLSLAVRKETAVLRSSRQACAASREPRYRLIQSNDQRDSLESTRQRMESRMSRRQFKQSILPTRVPPKYTKLPKRTPNNRRCSELQKFLLGLKKAAGDRYSEHDFAKACGVKKGSVKLWFYGRPYGALSGESIARYFAPLVNIRLPELRKQVEEARIKAWSNL